MCRLSQQDSLFAYVANQERLIRSITAYTSRVLGGSFVVIIQATISKVDAPCKEKVPEEGFLAFSTSIALARAVPARECPGVAATPRSHRVQHGTLATSRSKE